MSNKLENLPKEELTKKLNSYQSKVNEISAILKKIEEQQKRIGFKWY